MALGTGRLEWGFAPSGIIFLLMSGIALALQVERIKKRHDLVTYRDILAFSKGEAPVERDDEAFARKHPLAMTSVYLLVSGTIVACAMLLLRLLS